MSSGTSVCGLTKEQSLEERLETSVYIFQAACNHVILLDDEYAKRKELLVQAKSDGNKVLERELLRWMDLMEAAISTQFAYTRTVAEHLEQLRCITKYNKGDTWEHAVNHFLQY